MLKEFIKYKWRCVSDEVQGGIILSCISVGIFLLCFLLSVLFNISIGDSFMLAILLICLFVVYCYIHIWTKSLIIKIKEIKQEYKEFKKIHKKRGEII